MNYDAKISTAEEDERSLEFSPVDGSGEDDRRSGRRVWIIIAIAIAILVGLWLISRFTASEDLAGTDITQAPVVTVMTPGRTTIEGRISATGTLAARRELPIGSVGEGGQVARVLVEAGDWVKAGQVLAVIDRAVQTQQQAGLAAQVQVAQADARLAQANLDRALKLVDRGFISEADVDRLTATRDAAVARVNVARAQLAEMRARTNRLNIVAPAAGLVLDRNVEPGQVVTGGGNVLFSIAKGGEMELRADLSEEDLAKLSTGARATVTPVGLDQSFVGQVWQISPIIDPDDRQGEVRIALSYAAELRPGGFATAQVMAGTVVAPLLPESAVLTDDSGSYVYVIDKNDQVVRRAVKTGAITSDGVAVIEGLSGNERVVLRAGAFLSEGETVIARAAKR